MIKVSAIVSAYNAAQFIRGRIDDLMAQTLFKEDELEIIVVNSASTDSTGMILEREYLPHITLIQTPWRESMYAAWNRAIKLAKGDYIVPANCDDRFHPDSLRVLAMRLDEHPDTGLACADSIVTTTPNAHWDERFAVCQEPPYERGILGFPPPDALTLTQACVIGNAPMWRKALHEAIGYFDESYLIAGDYEWALRLAANDVKMDKYPAPPGLFYWNAGTQGRAYADQSAYESTRALLKWKPVIEANA